MSSHVLIVDDEEHVLKALKRALAAEDLTILTATGAARAEELLSSHPIKVVVSDECMPEVSGTEFLSRVSLRFPQTVRILLTGHASFDTAVQAINSGEIYRIFTKPWHEGELMLTLRLAIEKYDIEFQNRKLLSLVRCQAQILQQLEQKYPGITRRDQQRDGSFYLQSMTEKEIGLILKELGVAP